MSTLEPAPLHAGGQLAPNPLLPPEQPWLYVVAPLPAAYLMGHDWNGRTWSHILRSVLDMYLPFIVFGLAFHVLYHAVMPRFVAGRRSLSARAALHAVVVVVVTPIIAAGLYPVMRLLSAASMGYWRFLAISFIFTVACVFPSLWCQELRHRARSAEHRALALRKAALEAQLAALQARTDPHFLFNSLNTVASTRPVALWSAPDRLRDGARRVRRACIRGGRRELFC